MFLINHKNDAYSYLLSNPNSSLSNVDLKFSFVNFLIGSNKFLITKLIYSHAHSDGEFIGSINVLNNPKSDISSKTHF